MVYKWWSAWVPKSAKSMLINEDGSQFEPNYHRGAPKWASDTRKADFIIPDVMRCSIPSEDRQASLSTVSVTERVRDILSGDPETQLLEQRLYWPDGKLASLRFVVAAWAETFPINERHSRFVREQELIALRRTADRLVFDTTKLTHRIWRIPAAESRHNLFWARSDVVQGLLEAGCTGLYLQEFPEVDGNNLAGPAFKPGALVFNVLDTSNTVTERPLDGDLMKLVPVHPPPPEKRWLSSLPAYRLGTPVTPEHVPTKWYYGSSRRNLPGVMGSAGAITVDEHVRHAIEELEPDVHQFFPIDYVTKKGLLIQSRFLLIIGNGIEALHEELSDPSDYRFWWPAGYGDYRRVVVRKEAVEGKHLWIEQSFGPRTSFFASFEMASRLEKLNGDNLLFTPYETA